MRRSQSVVASLAVLAMLAACGGGSNGGSPVTPQTVSRNAVDISTPVVKQLASSLATLGGNAQLQDLLATLGLGTGTAALQLRSGISARQDAMSSAPRAGAVGTAVTWVRQQLAAETAADQTAQQFADFLSNKVFTQANLESSDATSATFLLRGSVVCADAAALPADVTACAQQLDAMKLRIRAVPHGDTALDLEIMLGAERVKPVMLALTNTPSIAVTVDFAAAKSAVGVLGAALGSPVQDLPTIMEGVVTVSLKVENQTKLTIDSGISRAIAIQVDGTTPPVSIHVGAVASLARLVADGAANTVELSGQLGAVALTAPEDEQVWSDAAQAWTTITHELDIALTSASGSLLLRSDGTARASFDVRGLEANRDHATLLAASLANGCTVELGQNSVDFVDALDASLSALDGAGQPVSYRVTAAGPFDVFPGSCDAYGSCAPDVFAAGVGATFDVTGGATPLHAAQGDCFDLDQLTLVACPAL